MLARTGVRTFASQDAPLPPGVLRLLERMPHVPMSATRNFCIIAHIDHGKSVSGCGSRSGFDAAPG